MMKRFFFYTILFCLLECVYGQISGFFYLDYTYYVTYYIGFYPNQYYLLGMQNDFDGQISSWDISFGKYTEENNEIILTDQVHGYHIILLHENDSLVMKSSFMWLKNQCFKYDGDVYNPSIVSDALDVIKDMPLSLEQERKEHQLSSTHPYLLKIGEYSDDYSYPYTLYIAADSTYSLEFWIGYWKIALFEGTWSRSGNELIYTIPVYSLIFTCL